MASVLRRWTAAVACILALALATDMLAESYVTASLLDDDIATAVACHAQTSGHLEVLAAGSFAQSEFFACFRPQDQVFQFFDAIAERTRQATAKRPVTIDKFTISTTVFGRDIPAYKLTTGPRSTKQSIYLQSGLHAREWISITSTAFTWATLLDAATSTNSSLSAFAQVLDEYDWVYVPIVNLDGYIYTWSAESRRYHRKNMQYRSYDPLDNATNMTAGVDLNRNFGPIDDNDEDSILWYQLQLRRTTGPNPFSEPEVQGIAAFVESSQKQVNGSSDLAGVLDIHSYDGLILTPFGNSSAAPDQPFGAAFFKLGQRVQSALRNVSGGNYTAIQAFDLYFAQGMFCDFVFATYKVPALVVEIEGADFR
ncbi:hypothetical protein AaE_007727, partial [Aphanomyces astaci]